jgi:hypothetical protein
MTGSPTPSYAADERQNAAGRCDDRTLPHRCDNERPEAGTIVGLTTAPIRPTRSCPRDGSIEGREHMALVREKILSRSPISQTVG